MTDASSGDSNGAQGRSFERVNESFFFNFSEFLGNFRKLLENFLEKSSAHYVIIEYVIRKRQKLDILNWSLGFTYFKLVKMTHSL